MGLWANIEEEKLDFYLIILKTREGTSLAVNGGDFTFQHMGCEFDPWLGSLDPICLMVKKPKPKTEAIL